MTSTSFMKSRSTEKSMAQDKTLNIQDYSTCPRMVLTDVKKKVLEPKKVSELFGLHEGFKSASKDTDKKKMQPERMIMYAIKDNIKVNKNMNGTNGCNQISYPVSRARRNLNFQQNSIGSQNNLKQIISDEKVVKKGVQSGLSKNIVPILPNSAKKKDSIQHNMKMRYSKISITGKDTDLIETGNKKEGNIKKIQLEDKQKFSKVSYSMSQKKSKNCENLEDNLQNTKSLESPHGMNSKLLLSDTIQISKEELVHLQSSLVDLKHALQHNLSELELTLVRVTNLLSIEKKEETRELTWKHETKKDKEVIKKTCSKAVQVTEDDLIVPALSTLKIVDTDLKTNLPINSNENEKENYQDSDSIIEANSLDESFLRAEKQLNIIYSKPFPKKSTCIVKTPVIIRGHTKMNNRSLSEYLALKSSMNFLVTPEPKKLRPICDQNDEIDVATLHNKNLSDRLFTTLCNLYSDSPNG